MQQGTRRHRLLVGLSVALILVVALSGPNAAKPDLRSGWPLDGLLPFTLSSALVTGLLWVAYAVAAVAIALALWRPVPALGRRTPWVLGGLGLLAVLAAPIGSADHVNYAAYGRILWLGGDPWTASPADFAGGSDPITSAVEEPWRTEPSVYGPLATLIQAGAAAIGGTHLRLVVLAWQVVVVAAWLLVRWCLRRLVDEENAGRVDVLWTLNPLVFAVGVLGAHVDVLATALVLTAFVGVGRSAGPAGSLVAGGLVAAATSVKFTYAVALLALLLAGRGVRRALWLLAGWGAVLVVLHLWTGGHVYDQVGRSRGAVSLATPWRLLLEWSWTSSVGVSTMRSIITVAAGVAMIGLAVLIWRATRPLGGREPSERQGSLGLARRAAWITLVLTAAYGLLAPYTLPWYDLVAWGLLPLVVPSVLDGILLARLTLIAAAYVPGRVIGMTPGVEALTLGLRREVTPWLQLGLWVVAVTLLLHTTHRRGRISDDDGPDGWGHPPAPRRRAR